MKIIKTDYKNGEVKLITENMDDLWYLSNIINEQDLVSGQTFRKIKIGGDDDRKATVVKKKVYITINVIKIEFHKYAEILRVSGTITEAPEDIPRGSHHTLNVEVNTNLKIKKEKWLHYQKKKLEESTKDNKTNILAVSFDREEAYFFKITRQGYEMLTTIKGQVAKKNYEQASSNFYEEILNVAKEYDKREKYSSIIMASPAFYNDELLKNLKDDELKKKIVMATCSGAEKNAIVEIMQRPELRSILEKDQTSKEMKLVEELLGNISREEKNVYSLKETRKAADAGAIEKLLLTDKIIKKYREEEQFFRIEKIMKLVDSMNGEVHIISVDHEGGQKLEGLGGIAATLRYDI